MGVLRLTVDLNIDLEKMNKGQADKLTKGLEDYASSVLAPSIIEKGLKETAPESKWHVHVSSNGNECLSCRKLARDEHS